MKLIKCIHYDSKCYKTKGGSSAKKPPNPVGIVVHSTGVNNPSLARYVQPSKSDPEYKNLLAVIGKNKYGNSWNRGVSKSTHYMIGKLADGSVATAQMLPEDISAWGVGRGKKGSYNYDPTMHIQFEICEDNLKDSDYFWSVYREAVELCADICKRYGWSESVIVSHHECYKKGYGSNHGDIDHWLKKYGLTMNDFRAEVKRILEPDKPITPIAVGDKVDFIGTKQWSNSGKSTLLFKKAKPCVATVKQIYKPNSSKHPYLIKGSGVYGWVNKEDVVR